MMALAHHFRWALARTPTYKKFMRIMFNESGKENADYLMEVMGAWQQHYKRAVYIDLGIGNGADVERIAQEQAERRGWTFERMAGDLILIRQLLEGNWGNSKKQNTLDPLQDLESLQNFLVVEPGQKVIMTYDEDIIGVKT